MTDEETDQAPDTGRAAGAGVTIERAPWATHEASLAAIRRAVFIVEQAVPEDEEWDSADASCEHFLARAADGEPIGCARLTPAGQIGRMAVLASARGQRVGWQLLHAAIERARALGLRSVFLHAQTQALPFYAKAGFVAHGELFLDAGIEHRAMTLELTTNKTSHRTVRRVAQPAAARGPDERPDPAAPQILLRPSAFRDESGAAQALVHCISQPQRRIALMHPDLDPLLFAQPAWLDGLSAFLRAGSRQQLRVLLHSSRRAVSQGHGLVELARRLDSRISIRRLPAEYATDERAFLSWDDIGYWLLPNADSYAGLINPDDAVMARRLTERFDYLWERAELDPELRALKL